MPETHKEGYSRSIFNDFLYYWDYYFGDSDEDESDVVVIPEDNEEGGGGEDTSKEKSKEEQEISSKMKVDLMKEENKEDHHTDKYSNENYVLRRGQEFYIKVTIDTKFDRDEDIVEFQFDKGPKPQVSKNTKHYVKCKKDEKGAQEDRDNRKWYGYIRSVNTSSGKTTITVAIGTSPDSIVGKYTLAHVKVYDLDRKKENKRRYVKLCKQNFYLIFNAWCKDDPVYMDDSDEREEYVLNETGRIWKRKASAGKPWNFGIYSRYVLQAAVYLLENSYLSETVQGDPVLVSRALTAMANGCDSDPGYRSFAGVLVGNWSGDYGDETKPNDWNGSQAILEQYMKTKEPVMYGQCWVFSGVLTSLCRTIGIPCRSVTNFTSAHDNDKSLTIDKHICKRTDDPLKHLDDSVWNFHVWNEAWFERRDLKDGYGGWQALDSTPQETSEGIFQCGPAPLKAIREGSVDIGYDTAFIFAEVNGVRIQWVVDRKTDEMTPSVMDGNPVGRYISTKKVGRDSVRYLTDDYKPKDGSNSEKEILDKALNSSSRKEFLTKAFRIHDVAFRVEIEPEKNGDVTTYFTAKNNAEVSRTVKYKLTGLAATYNDTAGNPFFRNGSGESMNLEPGKSQTKAIKIQGQDYLNLLKDEEVLEMFVWAGVKETDQVYTYYTNVDMIKPDIEIELSNSNPKVGEAFKVTMKMKNDTDVELTNCQLNIEGPGIVKSKKILLQKGVPPQGTMSESIELTAKYKGKRDIIVSFNSRQLVDICGCTQIIIKE